MNVLPDDDKLAQPSVTDVQPVSVVAAGESPMSDRERLFELIGQMQHAAGDTDPDEVMNLVLAVQPAVRAGAEK